MEVRHTKGTSNRTQKKKKQSKVCEMEATPTKFEEECFLGSLIFSLSIYVTMKSRKIMRSRTKEEKNQQRSCKQKKR